MSSTNSLDCDPVFPPKFVEIANDHRMHIAAVFCDEDLDAKRGQVFFTAITSFMPRVGELIKLEDGNLYEATTVWYQSKTQQDGYCFLIPHVNAVRVKQ